MSATYRTDKELLGYLPTYRELAAELGDRFGYLTPELTRQSLRVLEIGIGDGAGLEMLGDVFHTRLLYGIDNSPERVAQLTGTYAVICRDQDDPAAPHFWGFDPGTAGQWHLIVDDASHRPIETVRTLRNFWPTVRPGGAYVIEDWNYFASALMWSVLWQALIGHWVGWSYEHPAEGQPTPSPISDPLPDIKSVTIRHGMIVVRKNDVDV